MLKRKIDVFLQEWKNREHNPLIIKGARQIGNFNNGVCEEEL